MNYQVIKYGLTPSREDTLGFGAVIKRAREKKRKEVRRIIDEYLDFLGKAEDKIFEGNLNPMEMESIIGCLKNNLSLLKRELRKLDAPERMISVEGFTTSKPKK